ncbi:MAG: DUF167 domain-containing protein [Alphaproteobacteria bacterium]|nr:DUF167 domain-containing protein [Alphaproteobacteria bacterium]
MSFFEPHKTGCAVRIKLTPNAAFCGFGSLFVNADEQTYLKVYLTTAPEKGKANKELIKMLAKELKIPKQNIELISGATIHFKKLYIQTPLTPQLTEKLNSLIKEE